MKTTLEDLKILAGQAGEILRAGFGQGNQIGLKGEIDLVTEVDQQSEALLLAEITRKFPGHQIVSEETGGVPGDGNGSVWFIDPLDGTTNFAHGLPIFSVSIAYAENGQLKYAVVYDPIHEELYSAEKGKGAYLNGTEISVSRTEELRSGLLVTGFPYDRFTNPNNNLDHFQNFALQAQGVRRLGSAALDLCYVAAGKVDGFWEIKLQPYDVAAGTLIAREAGAKVTKLNGEEDTVSQPVSIVAANPVLHPKMLAVLEK